MSRLRVKGPRDGYRRAGRVFGKDWTEISPGDLGDEQVSLLLEDERLVLQVAAGEEDWSPFPIEERRQAVEAYRGRHVVVGDGSGESLATLDPELLKAAELGRDLLATIDLHREMLEGRGFWPVAVPQALFLDFAGRLGTAEGEVERLTVELKAAQPITPASDGPDGGGGDAAAPAATPPREDPKPAATAGGDADKPASKPKPAAGKKSAASKAG